MAFLLGVHILGIIWRTFIALRVRTGAWEIIIGSPSMGIYFKYMTRPSLKNKNKNDNYSTDIDHATYRELRDGRAGDFCHMCRRNSSYYSSEHPIYSPDLRLGGRSMVSIVRICLVECKYNIY